MLRRLSTALILLLACFLSRPVEAGGLPLPAEKAFVFSAFLEKADRLVIEWQVAPGYFVYRDKLHFSAEPAKALRKQQIVWPASQTQRGPMHDSFRAYSGHFQIALPLAPGTYKKLTITAYYQGCSQSGFCYAPMKKNLQLTYPFSAAGLQQAPLLLVSEEAPPPALLDGPSLLTDQGAAQAFLSSHTFLVTLLCFLGLGFLLAFTPCSLPMLPILSSILVGRKALTSGAALRYSLAYVLGMALTYALAGLLAAWLGSGIQAYFQSPWIISAFSGLFILLGLSLLNIFQLQLPNAWRQRLQGWQQKQKGGSMFGAFFLGGLSSLIVSPCVTAPLVGVLVYISETGNRLLGGCALFALGLGMGLPLLLAGFSTGKYLPKAGPWMDILQKLFACLLFGMSIWMLARILPAGVILFFWASLLILAAVFLFFIEGLPRAARVAAYFSGSLFVAYALILFVGVALGFTSPFYPFTRPVLPTAPFLAASAPKALNFIDLKNMAQLEALLAKAKRAGKPVLLDFYAEWCESCQALESAVFSRKEVQDKLQHFFLLRANVSENNAFDRTLLKRYHVIAPPTFIFFNTKGQEVMEKRIVGEVDHRLFLARADAL